MKKYEYVNVHVGKFIGAGNEEHRAIIDDHAVKGFRYVGYIPTKYDSYGRVLDIDLIFETDIENSREDRGL